ncbi:MAG: YtxH domain-containing protein [Dehalococcoidia bacterium]|nr:YtxH domain-containing protein [Dehalococcoidia bacterium]
MNKDHAIGFGLGLLTGAVIGGVIALLYAPQSGKETRQQIKDKAAKVADTLTEETSGVIDTVKEAVSEANRRGQAAVHALKG